MQLFGLCLLLAALLSRPLSCSARGRLVNGTAGRSTRRSALLEMARLSLETLRLPDVRLFLGRTVDMGRLASINERRLALCGMLKALEKHGDDLRVGWPDLKEGLSGLELALRGTGRGGEPGFEAWQGVRKKRCLLGSRFAAACIDWLASLRAPCGGFELARPPSPKGLHERAGGDVERCRRRNERGAGPGPSAHTRRASFDARPPGGGPPSRSARRRMPREGS